jgi:uncharacterized protein (TIGR02246 family)
MTRILLVVGILAGSFLMVFQAVKSQPEPKNQAAPDVTPKGKEPGPNSAPDRASDETAIRANVAAFVRAYNAGDAGAVAGLFLKDGQIMDKEGNTAEGREAIKKTFAEIFAAAPQKRLEVTVESIRFLGPDLAVEFGVTKETPAPGETPEQDRYTVLHVKRDGKWLMAMVRDAEGDPPSNRERLRPLAWLIGEWIDDGGSVVARSTCRWSPDGNFLLQDFHIQVAGRESMTGSQRIGWDPLAKRIRSWVFDSTGGYGESVWARDGNAWVIKATGVRTDGTTASATNFLVPTGPDGYVWRSTDRIVGDDVAPAIEVKVVRKPPQPKQ